MSNAAGQTATNFGTSSVLQTDGSPVQEAWVAFDASGLGGGGITRATLRLQSTSTSGQVRAVRRASPTWTEAGITWANKPGSAGVPHSGAQLGSVTFTSATTDVTLDVTSYVGEMCGGRTSCAVAFAVTTTGTTRVDVRARTQAAGPRLEVESQRPGVLWGADFESLPAGSGVVGAGLPYKGSRLEGSGTLAGASAVVSAEHARAGSKSLRFTLPAPTTTAAIDDVGRCQVVNNQPNGVAGDERWYGYSLYYDTGWLTSEIRDDRSFFFGGVGFRYTGTAVNGPGGDLDADLVGGSVRLLMGSNVTGAIGDDHTGEHDLGPFLPTGRWIDIVLHIRWSNGADGFREEWLDGVQRGRYDGPTLGPASQFEHRIGIYEGVAVTQTRVLYVDNHRVGTSYAAVDPAG